VPEPSVFKVDLVIEKLKSHKLPSIDYIVAELIKAGSRKIHFEIHKPFISIWNKQQLPEDSRESITVPINTKEDKTDCSNCKDISLFPTMYNILSDILLSS
jgi:hypothetical protein